MAESFVTRYGRWAVVAGASEGLGAAYAQALAARGCSLVLIARRKEALDALAAEIRARHAVEVRTLACDLADATFAERLTAETAALEVGVAVYNAAFAFMEPLLARPLADALRVVDVNVRGPLLMVHALAPAMVQRGRGAFVLMSSLVGFQGAPRIAVYAASKAFNTVLGEGLWAELAPQGIDVLVSCAGAILTPAYARAQLKPAPGALPPEEVAERTLRALGRGPTVIPGGFNQMANFVLRRLVSRRSAVSVMARSMADLA